MGLSKKEVNAFLLKQKAELRYRRRFLSDCTETESKRNGEGLIAPNGRYLFKESDVRIAYTQWFGELYKMSCLDIAILMSARASKNFSRLSLTRIVESGFAFNFKELGSN